MMRSFALLLFPLAISAPSAAQQAAADSARVYDLAEVEVLPRVTNAAEFSAALQESYPPHLRQAGLGGVVRLGFVVGPDGAPRDVRVVNASDSGFVAPSMAAVSLLRFTPAQLGGSAVAVRVVQPITWTAPAPAEDGSGEWLARRGETAHDGAPDGSGAYELAEVDEMPRLRDPGDFARALRRASGAPATEGEWTRTVQARFRVEVDGTTSHASITRSSSESLNAPTLRALETLRFIPARRGGQPVPVWVEQPVTWGGGPPSGGADAYEMAEVEEMPRLLNRDEFVRTMVNLYPVPQRDAWIGASVMVRFRVETDGTVSDPVVVFASNRVFASPTLQAVRVLSFSPGRIDRRPVPTWVVLPVIWSVEMNPEAVAPD